jgi:AmiR/NasT family two-component response regulator
VDRRTPELEASGVANAHLDRGNIDRRHVDNGQTDEVTALRLEVEQLRAALATRDMIWTAKAVIAATTGCTPQEAHELLVRQSQFEHRKLRDVALDLVKRHESSGRGG